MVDVPTFQLKGTQLSSYPNTHTYTHMVESAISSSNFQRHQCSSFAKKTTPMSLLAVSSPLKHSILFNNSIFVS
uniref:Uncharacterized protein n=1 Tax=Physcomitrium patens TaxID=3218 RepID=A0A2K1JLI8_PHYPA|nr:hypothetical protein PHYPA_017065 [Physcomitrium patens]